MEGKVVRVLPGNFINPKVTGPLKTALDKFLELVLGHRLNLVHLTITPFSYYKTSHTQAAAWAELDHFVLEFVFKLHAKWPLKFAISGVEIHRDSKSFKPSKLAELLARYSTIGKFYVINHDTIPDKTLFGFPHCQLFIAFAEGVEQLTAGKLNEMVTTWSKKNFKLVNFDTNSFVFEPGVKLAAKERSFIFQLLCYVFKEFRLFDVLYNVKAFCSSLARTTLFFTGPWQQYFEPINEILLRGKTTVDSCAIRLDETVANTSQEDKNTQVDSLGFVDKAKLIAKSMDQLKNIQQIKDLLPAKLKLFGLKTAKAELFSKHSGAKYTCEPVAEFSIRQLVDYLFRLLTNNNLKKNLSKAFENQLHDLLSKNEPPFNMDELFLEFLDGVFDLYTGQFLSFDEFEKKHAGVFCFKFINQIFSEFSGKQPLRSLLFLFWQFSAWVKQTTDFSVALEPLSDSEWVEVQSLLYLFCFDIGMMCWPIKLFDPNPPVSFNPNLYRALHVYGQPGAYKSSFIGAAFSNFFSDFLVVAKDYSNSQFATETYRNKKLAIFNEFAWSGVDFDFSLSRSKLLELLEFRQKIVSKVIFKPDETRSIVFKTPIILIGVEAPPLEHYLSKGFNELTNTNLKAALNEFSKEQATIAYSSDLKQERSFLRRTHSFNFPISFSGVTTEAYPGINQLLREDSFSFLFYCYKLSRSLITHESFIKTCELVRAKNSVGNFYQLHKL